MFCVVAHKALRFRLFARRDELRRLAAHAKESWSAFSYQHVENLICMTISVSSVLTFSRFIWHVLCHQSKPEPNEEFIRFKKEASPELIDLHSKTINDAIVVMMLNSPIVVLFSSVIGLILWIFGKINRMLIYTQAEHFVEGLPKQQSVPQPA
jgi:hypothetical protein